MGRARLALLWLVSVLLAGSAAGTGLERARAAPSEVAAIPDSVGDVTTEPIAAGSTVTVTCESSNMSVELPPGTNSVVVYCEGHPLTPYTIRGRSG